MAIKNLTDEHAVLFQHFITQLIYLSTLLHMELKTAVEYLTIMVKDMGKYNWGNLKKLLK